jgi:two-component system response regulator FixJ
MTAEGSVQSAVRAMKAGAVDFIEKPFDDEVLLNAIKASLSPAGRNAKDDDAPAAARRLAALSPREQQILDGLLAGRSNKLIAYDLGLSVRTVEVHRAHMMERLGVRQLSEAIRLAVMAKLVTGDSSDGGKEG